MINVIKASAGSGKTYQLTYEYIKLLLGVKRKGHYELAHENDHERHRHILAVTFTNKATGEMKERIVKELSILSGKVEGKSSPYMKDLCRDFGNVSPEEVEKAAYKALVDLLFDYTNFNVSTIDSFFQMILRTFAKDLKMSYDYDIELDDDYAIKVGVNDFLSNLAHERGVAPNSAESKRIRNAKLWIREFVKDEVLNGNKWNIFMESESKESSKSPNKTSNQAFTFNDFAKSLMTEELRQRIDDIIAYLNDGDTEHLSNRINDFKKSLYTLIENVKNDAVKASSNIIAVCAEEGFEEDRINSRGGLIWIKKITHDNPDCGLGTKKLADMLSTKEKSGSWFKKGKAKEATVLSDATISHVCQLIGLIAECKRKLSIYKELHRNVYMLGLLGEVSRYMSKFRKENDLILLADTNELLRRIINNEDTPFVYERVGIWLSSFLIDEFQDTSRAQWENMKPLLFNSCAEGSDNLIIGDEKQCIYRFRNADPSLLRSEVGKYFTVKQNDSGKCINWRSAPNVVQFNNEFFSSLASMLGAEEEYSNVVQELPNKEYDNAGYVEVNSIDSKKDSSNDENREEKFKEIVLKRLPGLIKDILSRGYKYSDIAVLTMSNKEGAEVIKQILDYNVTKNDDEPLINVISNESLMLKNSPAVRLVISHLRYLDSKMVEMDKTGKNVDSNAMEGYKHRLLREYESLMFKQGLEPGAAIDKCFETVDKNAPKEELSLDSLLPDNTESFNIISITEHIIAQNIAEDSIAQENAFIQAFQDCVVDFSNRTNASIHEFVKWWDRGGCNTSVNSPDGQNAINVLTIHKSKGLEFKCVILPFCDWDMKGKDEVLWIPKDQMLESGLLSGIDENLVPPLMPLRSRVDMDMENTGLKDFYKEKLQERIIDMLNKTYVGFTRAVEELYVFTPKKGDKTSDTMMSSLLSTLLNEDGVYTLGDKGRRKEKTDNTHENADTMKMPLYKVEDNKLEYTVPDMFTSEHIEKGKRLHNIFKRIVNKDDANTALLYYKARGVIPGDCYEDDCRIVKDALEDSRVADWFDCRNKVYNERGMVGLDKNKRPDRFVVTPDGRTIVIDYKFGKIHSKSYQEQVEGYMNILEQIGFKNIEGYIWYPLEKRIETKRGEEWQVI